MRLLSVAFIIALAIALSTGLHAWDHFYDGSVLPNALSLGEESWAAQGNVSMCATDGDLLRINDTRTDALESFSRGVGGGPITMESRLCVANGGSGARASMAVTTSTFSAWAMLYPDHLQVLFDYGDSPVVYQADLTTYHALRMAINAEGQCYVWLDRELAAQGETHVGGQGCISFGGPSESDLGESSWDYVAYSSSFLPVPEPSTLSFLSLALAGIGVGRLRRRRAA